MFNDIDKQIAALDLDLIIKSANCGDLIPRDYQCLAYKLAGEAIRHYDGPAFVTASVGAGKTIMMAMLAKRFQDMGMPGIVLARSAELVEQNAEALWMAGCKNSIFSASAGIKSAKYPVIVGSEKSIFNSLNTSLSDFCPAYVLLDEAHMLNVDDIQAEHPDTQYAQILIELQRRCLAKNGKQLRVLGFTGSPFRGTKPILGTYWKKQICDIPSEYLVKRGFLVPTFFGYVDDDVAYDLSAFRATGIDGTADFTLSQLEEMQKEIMSQGSKTQKIMLDVVARTKDRNGVLITCSGKKHCEEAARYLPKGSYVIVTETMGMKSRKAAIDAAKYGKVKYVFQIGCLTTGVDVSYWDTSVILRKIGSLTLLIQLLGRGMRLLKPFLSEAGIIKEDHLVLDYTDTMAELGEMYANPILEQAALARAKKNHDTKKCPSCGTENAPGARRCIGESASSPDGRCEYFWSSKVCEDRMIDGIGKIKGCGTMNDPSARNCRCCGEQIYDPNANLQNRPYTDNDYCEVKKFDVRLTSDGAGLLYEYHIETDGKPHVAREVFWPESTNQVAKNMWRTKGIFPHVKDPKIKSMLIGCKSAKKIIENKSFISAPVRITHRFNDKRRDVINRKEFNGK